MRRQHCGACGGSDLIPFLNLGETPVANTYPATLEEAQKQPRYPLEVGLCGNCGLSQLLYVVPDAEIYNDTYGFYSSGSEAQRQYHSNGFKLLRSRYAGQAKRGVVEVACNDGGLLKHFYVNGYPTLGIDPASGPVAVARKMGLDVVEASLTTDLAVQLREERGPAGLVIAYNSMAHVENLNDVLSGIRVLMDAESVAVFEVQYLPDLLIANMYDQVYHEHRYFYSLTSLWHVAALYGLYVIDAELIELQGGGLRVTLSTNADRMPTTRVASILQNEKWLTLSRDHCIYNSFQGQVERTRDHLTSIIDVEKSRGHNIAGYAAAAKATTIVNFCELDSVDVKHIVDTTTHKQGRYLPGTDIKILAPEDAPNVDTLLLLSSNYLGTVLRTNPHIGSWIVPLPLPMII